MPKPKKVLLLPEPRRINPSRLSSDYVTINSTPVGFKKHSPVASALNSYELAANVGSAGGAVGMKHR